ncbi:DUF3349 domain-containing protein [Nocardia sp. CDC153]|uniref:DUF3349 domain-containing protein n=1 Tax=Nocardia sp. CDC153 TaxID=3112167 RepID=UPI002DBC260D|nr:DUF3349 domain-containing protein [Nocardia sp. CDC153]MEC3956350.1 DUF3349 domain-containing protein [Nocardia sp. CDC153]
MALSELLARIVAWLRAGYPQGVPDTDYLPLLAVLAKRLTEDQVRQVAAELILLGALPADRADVGVLITKLTDEMPRDSDLERVRAQLRAGGWPIDEGWPQAPE